jgi:hypothetical protein
MDKKIRQRITRREQERKRETNREKEAGKIGIHNEVIILHVLKPF